MANDVFVNQSLLQLKLNTRHSLSGATVLKILYTKPDGVTSGFFTATASGTYLTYNVQAGDIDVAGEWTFQAYAEIAGLIGWGSLTTKTFLTPITP